MAFLAIIGIVAILIVLSKGLKAIGIIFETVSEDLSNRAVSKLSTKSNIFNNTKKTKEKIDTIKGNDTDTKYWNSVNNEIDDLCK